MAGHSKWANIKHTKARMDAKRSKVFAKIAREITIGARLGGGDADMNPRLRLALKNTSNQFRRFGLVGVMERRSTILENIINSA